jgi:hypothetical protein
MAVSHIWHIFPFQRGAYPFAILSMMLLFICFVVLLYAHLKRQRSTLSEILVVFAAILTSHSFVLVIFNLKIFYFLVFMSTLAAYFLLHQIKRQGSPYLHVFLLFLFKDKFLYGAYYLAIVAVLSSSLYLFEPSLYPFYYILFIFFFLDRAKKRKPFLWLSACIVIGFNFLILPAGSGSPMDFQILDYESGNEIMNFYSHYKSQNVTLYAVSAELLFMFLFYDTQCNVERQDSFKPCQSDSVLAIPEESLEEFLDKCPEFNYVGQISSRIFVFESPDN